MFLGRNFPADSIISAVAHAHAYSCPKAAIAWRLLEAYGGNGGITIVAPRQGGAAWVADATFRQVGFQLWLTEFKFQAHLAQFLLSNLRVDGEITVADNLDLALATKDQTDEFSAQGRQLGTGRVVEVEMKISTEGIGLPMLGLGWQRMAIGPGQGHRYHLIGHIPDSGVADGAAIRYHGDLDPAGLAIAADHIAAGCQPWRVSASDLTTAPSGPPFDATPPATPWDPDLAFTLATRGRAVHEEAVIAELLRDLAEHAVE